MTETERSAKLTKVRALLAKAESSEFPEEAKAFFAAAQRLMTSYAIEDAELRDLTDSDETPTVSHIVILPPYVRSKGTLLGTVARNNNCQVVAPYKVKGKDSVTYELFGFANRVASVEELYTSLLVQMSVELAASNAAKPDWVHGKTWANNFLDGFACEIGSRLRKARDEAVREVGNALVLLRSEDDQVNQHVALVYPRLGKSSRTFAANTVGHAAGRAAGSRASLGGRTVSGGSRGALG